MVDAAVNAHCVSKAPCSGLDEISLHCDNCGGQNKNRWVIWYVVFLSMTRFKVATLRFLIPGHTKNRCDSAFGLVKREVKRHNIDCPADMFQAISNCSRTTSVVEPCDVQWRNWKEFFNEHFMVPSKLKVNSNYLFQGRQDSPGTLFVKQYSTTNDWIPFNVVKRTSSAANICQRAETLVEDKYQLVITPLSDIIVARNKTREQYLTEEVCNRYHRDDSTYRSRYFANGADWKQM